MKTTEQQIAILATVIGVRAEFYTKYINNGHALTVYSHTEAGVTMVADHTGMIVETSFVDGNEMKAYTDQFGNGETNVKKVLVKNANYTLTVTTEEEEEF